MDYQKHYDLLINRAKNRILEGYVEKHHVIPRCMGGSDEKENLVSLTPEEYYTAYQLLVQIYPGNHKLVYAAVMMTICDGIQQRSNKLYGWLKKHKIPPMTGKKHSEETKKKMSLVQKGRKVSAETRAKISRIHKGKPKSDEQRKKMSAWQKGKPKSEQAKLRMKEAWVRQKLRIQNV
jgi:hypothetical protein